MIFHVLTARLPEALVELKKLAKRAARFGDTISFIVRDSFSETFKDVSGYKRKIDYTNIEAEGLAVNFDRFEFLAKVEWVSGEAMVNSVPGTEGLDLRFRSAKNVCEHCNKSRTRNALYVVREKETGRQMPARA